MYLSSTDIEKNPGHSVYVDSIKTIHTVILHTVKETLQYFGKMLHYNVLQ